MPDGPEPTIDEDEVDTSWATGIEALNRGWSSEITEEDPETFETEE